MREIQIAFICFLIFTFFLGVFVCSSSTAFDRVPSPSSSSNPIENMETYSAFNTQSPSPPDKSCYNVLLKRGTNLLLYNTYQSESATNPIVFANLDEYIEFTENQRKNGLRCPVLYLQPENNTQGQDVYRIRPSPFSLEGGLPPVNINAAPPTDASRSNPKFNKGYSGFDPYGQDIGKYTALDKIHDSTKQAPVSDNPMDTNWGGVIHSQQMIDSGKYDENTVGKPLMVPRVLAIQTPPNFPADNEVTSYGNYAYSSQSGYGSSSGSSSRGSSSRSGSGSSSRSGSVQQNIPSQTNEIAQSRGVGVQANVIAQSRGVGVQANTVVKPVGATANVFARPSSIPASVNANTLARSTAAVAKPVVKANAPVVSGTAAKPTTATSIPKPTTTVAPKPTTATSIAKPMTSIAKPTTATSIAKPVTTVAAKPTTATSIAKPMTSIAKPVTAPKPVQK